MFLNSQSALPLPLRQNLERYRKIGKELVKACRNASESVNPDGDWADVWSQGWIEQLVPLSGISISPHLPVRVESWIDEVAAFARRQMRGEGRQCALADAQFVIARSHGFQSWPRFVQHLDALENAGSADSRFEAAAEAVVCGDAGALKKLLDAEPGLAQSRSSREHCATLLHYTAANGVEGYRQRTPANVVEMAGMLLAAGAEVNATAHVYGADCTTLGLVATSGHPERAGVQKELLTLLLDHGAATDASLVKTCLANGRLQAAEFLAEHLADTGIAVGLAEAAGLGRLDWVARFFSEDGSLSPGMADAELQQGFLYACQFGQHAVISRLLDRGVMIASADARGQTGLHHAVIGAQSGIVKLLLGHHPPLEAVNCYGGTPLGQALWSAAHGGDLLVYMEILESLVSAGAKLPERHVPVNPEIDIWLERHGSHAEPGWNWYGEGRKSAIPSVDSL
jgi:ankyrin repeat protein